MALLSWSTLVGPGSSIYECDFVQYKYFDMLSNARKACKNYHKHFCKHVDKALLLDASE